MHLLARKPDSDWTKAAAQWASGGSTYDAVSAKGRRQQPTGILRSEDDELRPGDRKMALSATNTLNRNFSVAAWAIRSHLNYVSTFAFQARNENEALNSKLESLVAEKSKAENFDITGRYSRQRFIRMAEMRRTIDGDMGMVKLRSGHAQAVEGDCVRTPDGGLPEGYGASDFIHGVRTNIAGRPLEYCICKRTRSSDAGGASSRFEFDRLVPAKFFMHFGYFDRFNQVRGISPLLAAFNSFRDVYEGCDYALAKMKVSQLFGLVFSREKNGEEETTLGPPVAEDDSEGYKVDLKRGGPFSLDLDDGDKAEFIESRSPSSEFQSFAQVMIAIALKSLDIPYSFFSENFTNYSGARQALLQYQASAAIKQQDVRELLDKWLRWQLFLWSVDGELPGVDISTVKFEWIAKGMPWIDPLKEVTANTAAITAGLTSRTRLLRESGEDFREVAIELAAEQKLFRELGLATDAPTDPKLLELAINAN